MVFKKKLSALKVPHNKHTAGIPSVRVAPPKEVLLPMSMHAGAPSVPVVAVGDYVRVGQEIGRADGRFGCPVHATVSGTVTAIGPYQQADGSTVTVIRIESDGKMERDPNLKKPEVHDLDEFLAAIQSSGIVGLGGAAFPLWGKLDAVRRNKIDTVLINGAECKPYITSDHRTMVEHSDLVVKGVAVLKEWVKAERFVIGIENNKPDAIAEMKRVFADDPAVEVMELKSIYPQGAKQVLLYNVTGKVVKGGQRLASLGVIIINITTLAKMAQFMEDGTPLIDRCVTVDGSAVAEPKNIVVPVGTPMKYLIEQAGGLSTEPGKILIGGPMLGVAVQSLEEPIQKATNAVLAFNQKESRLFQATDCIHCGRCVANCPVSLNPTAIDKAMRMEDEDARAALLKAESLKQCIECACCSYVCPAHRPLMETNKQAKRFLRKYDAAKKEREGDVACKS